MPPPTTQSPTRIAGSHSAKTTNNTSIHGVAFIRGGGGYPTRVLRKNEFQLLLSLLLPLLLPLLLSLFCCHTAQNYPNCPNCSFSGSLESSDVTKARERKYSHPPLPQKQQALPQELYPRTHRYERTDWRKPQGVSTTQWHYTCPSVCPRVPQSQRCGCASTLTQNT